MITIYSQDIGMEFGIEKCTMIKIKKGKREMSEEIKLANEENIRTVGAKENYKYLAILKNTTKQTEKKEKVWNKYIRRIRKFIKTKLYRRNLIKETNTWTVSLYKILSTLLRMAKRGNQTSGP